MDFQLSFTSPDHEPDLPDVPTTSTEFFRTVSEKIKEQREDFLKFIAKTKPNDL